LPERAWKKRRWPRSPITAKSRSKDALIFAIINTHLVELEASLAALAGNSVSPEHKLRELVGVVLEKYRGADDAHKVQLVGTDALTNEQRAEIRAVERRIVRHFSKVLRKLNPALDCPERPLLMPITMSLFGIMNWVYTWFRDGGRISREEYADVTTTMILQGIRAVR
jgi:AcrR family transcriptional regulator